MVVLSLVGGSLVFVAMMVAVAWVFAVPHGVYAPRRVAPVLDLAVRRAAEGSALGVHALYSQAGLRQTTLDAIEAMLMRDDAFEGAEGVTIRRVTPIEGLDVLAPQAALVDARVRYGDGRPSRDLSATLDLEDGEWRIRSMAVAVAGPEVAP